MIGGTENHKTTLDDDDDKEELTIDPTDDVSKLSLSKQNKTFLFELLRNGCGVYAHVPCQQVLRAGSFG